MNLFLVCVILAGGVCQQGVCQQQIVAKQVVAHAQPVLQVPYVDPYWSYVVGDNAQQRLRRLEEIVDRQQQLAEKQATLIEALHARRTETPETTESAFALKSKEIIAANCLKCHQGETAKGNIRLDGELTVAEKLLITQVVDGGIMPPEPAQPLSDEDSAAIAVWATEDKKAVRDFLRSKKEPQP